MSDTAYTNALEQVYFELAIAEIDLYNDYIQRMTKLGVSENDMGEVVAKRNLARAKYNRLSGWN